MPYTKDELSQLNDVVYGAITKFYQKVISPEMATKEDLKKMATKVDIEDLRIATKQDLGEAEERLTNRIDKIAGVMTDTRTNHERRIRVLEDEADVVPEARLTF